MLLALMAASAAATAACAPPPGGAAVEVAVTGFKDRRGQVRVQLYRARQDELLASGKYVTRVDTPTAPDGDMHVCATVPTPGDYVVAVLHDRNVNGRLDPFSDGVGFSNNPRLRLAKPAVAAVQLTLPEGAPTRIAVRLNYLQGLSVRPVANPR